MSSDRARVRIPAELAADGTGLPDRCARHGRPAARRADFALQSKVRVEGNRALSANALSTASRLSRYAERVRVVPVRAWPLCRSCLRLRRSWLAVTLLLFVGGLTAFVGSLLVGVLSDDAPRALAGAAAGGFVALVLSALPFSRAGLGRIAGAFTSDDGTEVEVADPSAEFTTDLARHRGPAPGPS
ncbi:hypothetical protein FFT09_03600 [Saccharomonospora piscinae]|uniref:hypothetical protein n=1 Tax=Saccharomonospora piscinae TaxID=687388 RepID=UPI001106A22C|nr:hypothetical protein [Saccharomonospora piscinae]TLW94947.1 hypothetical protein FFT09_03600 [Saccharomonospora piscinae]